MEADYRLSSLKKKKKMDLKDIDSHYGLEGHMYLWTIVSVIIIDVEGMEMQVFWKFARV